MNATTDTRSPRQRFYAIAWKVYDTALCRAAPGYWAALGLAVFAWWLS